jgi:hypothetical protein
VKYSSLAVVLAVAEFETQNLEVNLSENKEVVGCIINGPQV